MRRIGFIVYPGFQVLGLSASTVFEIANRAHPDPVYAIEIMSEKGGPVAGSAAVTVDSEPFPMKGRYDTLIVCGGVDSPRGSPELVEYLRQSLPRVRRLASICTGAFILAQAGLLDGRRVTTHWFAANELRRQYPSLKVEEDRIFIIDGPVWTSAGMTTGIDLALAMVEKDFGPELSRSVARKLVLHHRRSGGQSQHSALLELAPKSDRIQAALEYAQRNLRHALAVEDLADAAHLSPRQFSRAFRAETGRSPAKGVERLRVEAARVMLEDGRHSLEVIARETGFANHQRMRHAFERAFGQSPQTMRRSLAEE